MGSVDAEDAIPRIIAKACSSIVVSVEYRLAPAHVWPAAHEDCYEAAKYCIEHAGDWGADTERGIVISGASAGGNLAISTALRLADEGLGSKVSGVAAMVPVTVHPDAVPEQLKAKYTSYDEHANHTVNTKDAMEAFFSELTHQSEEEG
jgi:versiconal hemiacetal acetate esterase